MQRYLEQSELSSSPSTFQRTEATTLLQRQKEVEQKETFRLELSLGSFTELLYTNRGVVQSLEDMATNWRKGQSIAVDQMTAKILEVTNEILANPEVSKIVGEINNNSALQIAVALLTMLSQKGVNIGQLNACYGNLKGTVGAGITPRRAAENTELPHGIQKFTAPVKQTDKGITAIGLMDLKLPKFPVEAYGVLQIGNDKNFAYFSIDSSLNLQLDVKGELSGGWNIDAWFTTNLSDKSIGFGAGINYQTELSTDSGYFAVISLGGAYLQGFEGMMPITGCIILNFSISL